MSSDDVRAPALREVAEIWWDADVVPVVRWRDDAQLFVLVDPSQPAHELVLARLADAPDDPRAFALVLAEGLASCDFPPTGRGAAPGRVRATLTAARRSERLDESWG